MLTQIKDNQITFTDARFYIDRETGANITQVHQQF